MKKGILMIAACCLGGCNDDPPAPGGNKYDELNAMLRADYSKILITVTDDFGEDALTSTYELNYSESSVTVRYSVERFAEIGGLLDDVTDAKTTLVGEAVIKDGQVISNDGEVALDASIADLGLCFKEEYFENVQLTGVYLKADVKEASKFLGVETVCTDVEIEATFLEVFYDISVRYTSERGGKVSYRYEFTL